MTHLPPVFQKILGDTLHAYGMKPADYQPPRPPEEVRLLLGAKTDARQTQDKRAGLLGSADAI